MRFSSIRYLLREGFRNIWQNRWMSVASVCVLVSCLLITGAAYLVFVNVEHMFEWVYDQNIVVVYADLDATEDELSSLQARLEGTDNVQSVEFLSKDEILQRYADSFSPALFEQLQGENNPMQDAFIVTFSDLALLDSSMQTIGTYDGVESMEYNGDLAAMLTRIRNILFMAGGWVIALLLIVSLFIISNTIKLTVYSRRLEIGIMKSVGATNTFIRIPFIIEGMVLGLVAGLLTFGITYLIYHYLEKSIQLSAFLGLVRFSELQWILLAGFLAAGVLTGILGSAISMGRYLKEKGRVSLE